MPRINAERKQVEPVFDLMQYLDLNAARRVEQTTLEMVEQFWNDWKDRLQVVKFMPEDQLVDGMLLVFLPKSVEEQVEKTWQESPTQGLWMHNLAIHMVMNAAAQLVPELEEGHCAPLIEPSREMRKKLAEGNLEWNPEGTMNRQYAVFTPHPYRGGCEICMLKEACPKSRVRSDD